MAKRLAAIARASAIAGIKGAALQAAKEFYPAIAKIVLTIIIFLILFPILIVAALPNIYFRYGNSDAEDIKAMSDKAKVIENAYKSTKDYNEKEVERLIEELTATGDYDDIVINDEAGNMNHYWFIAICSVAYNQDLFAMNEDDIKNKTLFGYIFDTDVEDYTEGEAIKELKRLKINVRNLDPEELMNNLNFTDEQKNWARTIYRTIADDQTIRPGDPDYIDAANLPNYGDIIFTEGQTEVVYYNQGDSRWGGKLYGKYDTIKEAGCGPTSLAIVVSSLTSAIINPEEMSNWAYENGYRCEGSGSYHSLIPEGAEFYGLKVEGATQYEGQKIADALANGKLVVAIMGPGHFTTSGHFIVLRGVTGDGKILVADPASVTRSNMGWDLSIILNEARRGAAAGGPLWIVSK